MAIPDAQGTTVSWDGRPIGGFVRFDSTPASCSASDVSGLSCTVIGSGIASRIVRRLHPGPIEPGTATIEILGAPAIGGLDCGAVGQLTIAGPWGGVNYDGFISKFTVGGSVGELVRSTIEFQFT